MYAQTSLRRQRTNFDTLQYAKRAEKVGFTKEQAEFQAEEMLKVIDESVLTKSDILEIKKEFTYLEIKLQSIEYRLTIKTGAMLVMAVGVLTTILRLF